MRLLTKATSAMGLSQVHGVSVLSRPAQGYGQNVLAG
jgi:hypothetical protein